MKIIEKYADGNFLNRVDVRTQRFQTSIYHITNNVIECVRSTLQVGNTAVLFSGNWRFNFDAVYLEAKFFEDTTISLKENTYFVEPIGLDIRPNGVADEKLHDKIMRNTNAANILILHSALFCNYQSMDTIIRRMKRYQQFQPKQILLSVPYERVHFNRLKYTASDIAQHYQAEIVDDSFVVQLRSIFGQNDI